MAIKDGTLLTTRYDDWHDCLAPKVQGTWNLHEALLTRKEPLDFFVLFSSNSGVIGQPGQANYAAANTFLDAFVQFRHSLGFSASAINIGVMDDIGYVSEHAEIRTLLRAQNPVIYEQDLLDALQLAIHRSLPIAPKDQEPGSYTELSQFGIGFHAHMLLDAPGNRTLWKRDPRTAAYRNMEQRGAATGPSSQESLKIFLRDTVTDPASFETPKSVAFLAGEIGKTLFEFLMRNEEDLDLDVPLTTYGIDSLLSIEVRNWIRQSLGVEMSMLEILHSQSIMDLGASAVRKLHEKHTPSS